MNYLKLALTLVLTLTIIFFANSPVSAQSLFQNPSNINVDNLTDAQIRQIIQQAQATGQNDTQLIQYAQSKGMSADQIQHLQTRIADVRQKDKTSQRDKNNTVYDDDTLSRSLNYKPDSDSLSNVLGDKKNRGPRYLGLIYSGTKTFHLNQT